MLLGQQEACILQYINYFLTNCQERVMFCEYLIWIFVCRGVKKLYIFLKLTKPMEQHFKINKIKNELQICASRYIKLVRNNSLI